MPEKDELLAHDYDGIQEYDNSLPNWWLGLFWVTIIFAAGYMLYFHFGPGLNQEQMLARELAELPSAPAPSVAGEAELLALVSNAEALEVGKQVFLTRCMACHQQLGQGLVGPNLTDDYWIHGGKITDIRNTVENGVAAKGMIAWKGQISDSEIRSVVAYVWTLHGTNPPNPKPPEGQLAPR